MKKFIFGILFVALTAYGVTEFGDLTVTGSITSVGNLTTQSFLSANTGIASLNGGTLRLHESNTNGGSKITIQTVTNLASDYVLTLPPDDGSSGQVLVTDGNGVLTWDTNGGVTASSTTTFTNKTFDADGTGNSISNIENADIKSAAAIALNKLAAVTASRVAVSDGSGFLGASATVDTTELGLLDGVTGVLTTNAGTQTLTNKTLTSPIVGTTATFENNASAQFFEATGGGSSKVTVAAPAALAGDVTFTLPPDNGTNGYVLQTNGSGVTSWVAQSGGGGSFGLYCKITYGFNASAEWRVTGTTFAIPAADTDYPTPTVTTTSIATAAGVTCSAPGTKVYTLVTTSLPAGEYHVVAKFSGRAANTCYARITDGTTTGEPVSFGTNLISNVSIANHVIMDIIYGSTTSKDFSVELATVSGTDCFIPTNADSKQVVALYVYRVR